MNTTQPNLQIVDQDSRTRHTVKATKAHPQPFIFFRGGNLVPILGTTDVTVGSHVCIFYDARDLPEARYVTPGHGYAPLFFVGTDTTNVEKWAWENDLRSAAK